MSIIELAKIGLFSQLVTFLFKERLWQFLFLDRVLSVIVLNRT